MMSNLNLNGRSKSTRNSGCAVEDETMLVNYERSERVVELEKMHAKSTNIMSRYTVEELSNWKYLDLYFILGISNYRGMEIPSYVIDFMYKKKITEYHPDRSKAPIDAYFAVQNAYKTLKDRYARLKYDEFWVEEVIIEDRAYDELEFFQIAEKFFSNYEKFSVRQPVPRVGDSTTKIETINDFYAFFSSFQSKRSFEFLVLEEEEEKERTIKEMKKKEFDWIQKNLSAAKKNDPRLKKYRKENNLLTKVERLAVNGWTEKDIDTLKDLIKKNTLRNKINWMAISKKFKTEDGTKKNMKEMMDMYQNLKK